MNRMVFFWVMFLGLGIGLLFPGSLGADESAASSERLSPQQVAQYRRVMSGPDFPAAIETMRTLAEGDEQARSLVQAALRSWLSRADSAVVRELGRVGDPEALQAAQAEMDQIRAAARENIRALDQGERMVQAREYYNRLKAMFEELGPIYERRAALMESAVMRGKLLEIRELVESSDQPTAGDARIDRLNSRLEETLGMTVSEAEAVLAWKPGDRAMENPLHQAMAHYLAVRSIMLFNRQFDSVMDEQERINTELVNRYRIYLGLLPVEVDPRLVQSSRRHSKAMADLGFFAHESPVADNRTHTQRMRNAGYGRGFSENIAMGTTDGERAFWMWFGSPPHHRGMVHPDVTALGVGRWHRHWTQNFGRGGRMMLMSDQDREKIRVEGDILAPSATADRPTPRRR